MKASDIVESVLNERKLNKNAVFVGIGFKDVEKMFDSSLSKTQKLLDKIVALKRKFSTVSDIEKNYPSLSSINSKKFLNDITEAFSDLNRAIEDNIDEIEKKEKNHVYFDRNAKANV